LTQEEKRLQKEREIAAKLAARTMTKDYMSSLQDTVLSRLARAGHFQDPLVQEVEHIFMPWLAEATVAIIAATDVAQQLTHAVIGDAASGHIDARTAVMEAIAAEAQAKLDAIAAAEAEKLRLEEEARRAAEQPAEPVEGEAEPAPAE
jgi:hypothetical protein